VQSGDARECLPWKKKERGKEEEKKIDRRRERICGSLALETLPSEKVRKERKRETSP
jgi:hypothetical protein